MHALCMNALTPPLKATLNITHSRQTGRALKIERHNRKDSIMSCVQAWAQAKQPAARTTSSRSHCATEHKDWYQATCIASNTCAFTCRALESPARSAQQATATPRQQRPPACCGAMVPAQQAQLYTKVPQGGARCPAALLLNAAMAACLCSVTRGHRRQRRLCHHIRTHAACPA